MSFLARAGFIGVSFLGVTHGLGFAQSKVFGTQPPVIAFSAGASILQPQVYGFTVALTSAQPAIVGLEIVTLVQPPVVIQGIEVA